MDFQQSISFMRKLLPHLPHLKILKVDHNVIEHGHDHGDWIHSPTPSIVTKAQSLEVMHLKNPGLLMKTKLGAGGRGVLRNIPVFLSYLGECKQLRAVYMEDGPCREMGSDGRCGRDFMNAMQAVLRLEQECPGLDMSTMRAVIEKWMHEHLLNYA